MSSIPLTSHVNPAARKRTVGLWANGVLLALGIATAVSAYIDISTHKWLGIGMVLMVAAHLALHWRWIAYWGSRIRTQRQLKLLLDGLMLIVFGLMVLSGIIVTLIYAPQVTHFHTTVACVFAGLVLLHLAVNRKWIVSQITKCLRRK